MEADFWLERWREGKTGFHQNRITPPLQKLWPGLGIDRSSRVLVPLCGKSRDMVWLAEQGHDVLGVELSPLAVEQFFRENGLHADVTAAGTVRHYRSGRIEIICGDIFAIPPAVFGDCGAVFDRAALIALPADMRGAYAHHVYSTLAPDYAGMLITLEYEQDQMEGPPFSVMEIEVREIMASHTCVEVLDRRDILEKETKFLERGLQRLDTVCYRLSRCPAASA